MVIAEGTVLILDYGAVDRRETLGPFVVLRAFDQHEAVDAFLGQHPRPASGDLGRPVSDGFVTWMTARGYVRPLPAHRWDLGMFRFDPVIEITPDDPA